MTGDLANITARIPRQGRKVDRRSGILPEIDTRQRARKTYGDMRNARRGNGNAEALIEALGVVQDASKDVQGVINKADQRRQEELGAQGQLDQAAGTIDPEREKKSTAYREAVSLGRTTTEWARHKEATDSELQTFIESQDDLDLVTRRDNAARWIEDRYFKAFAVDPETGRPRDTFGTPAAMRAAAEAIGRNRPQLLQEAFARIDERMNGEALRHFSDHVIAAGREGSFDLTIALKMVPAAIPQETITATYVAATKTLVLELNREAIATDNPGRTDDAIGVLDQMLGYAKSAEGGGPGLPELAGRFGLSASERLEMLELRRSLVEKRRAHDAELKAKRSDAYVDSAAMRLVGEGLPMTRQEVEDAVGNGTVDGSTGASILRSMDAALEAETARADARAARADRERDQRRETAAAGILNAYGTAVLKGSMTPAEGRRRMLTELPAIRDPLIRAAVMSQAGSFFNSIEGLRMDTPEARAFGSTIDRSEQSLIANINPTQRILRHGGRAITADQATGLVKLKVDEFRMRGATQLRDTGKAPDPKALQVELANWFNATFPPKAR